MMGDFREGVSSVLKLCLMRPQNAGACDGSDFNSIQNCV